MKHICPTCSQAGISSTAKRWSSRECPAACGHCGGLSHVIASTSNGIFVGTLLAFVVGAVVGAATGGWWVSVLFGLGFASTFNVLAWSRAEMFPIPKDSARSAQTAVWLLIAFELLMALFS